MLYKVRNETAKFYDDYSSMMSEEKLNATKGAELLSKCFKDYQ